MSTTLPPCRACPDDWFVEDPFGQPQAARAGAGCPLLESCRRLGRLERHGVWGGTTIQQRFAERHAA